MNRLLTLTFRFTVYFLVILGGLQLSTLIAITYPSFSQIVNAVMIAILFSFVTYMIEDEENDG